MDEKLFFETFLGSKDVRLKHEEVRQYLDSIKKSMKLLYAVNSAEDHSQTIVAKKLLSELMADHEKNQWPILKKINDRRLDIYDGLSEGITTMFILSISDELKLRSRKFRSDKDKIDAWNYLKAMIRARAELYREKFGMSDDDLETFKKQGADYAKKEALERTLKKVALIGAGALASVVFVGHLILKPKDGEK
jgi:hypothetical protein